MPSRHNRARWVLTICGVLALALPFVPWSLINTLELGMGLAVLTAGVSLGAGYAMKYARPWTSWVATIASLLLIIAGFPWLTAPGIFVLFALAGPPKEKPQAHKKSGGSAPWWISPISGALLIFGWGFLMRQGETWGLTATELRPWLLPIWFCGSLADITVHELGHTLAAWAVGFRVRSICIGPLLIWNDLEKGHRFQWQWKRLFVQSGYMGCIPNPEDGVRWNIVLILLCGPLISIIAGLGFFSLLLAAPGSAWEQYWEILCTLALIFVVDSLVSLIPAGELDGAHLLHLILWTDKGRSYLASLRSGKLQQDTTASRTSGDLDGHSGQSYEASLAAFSRAINPPEDNKEAAKSDKASNTPLRRLR